MNLNSINTEMVPPDTTSFIINKFLQVNSNGLMLDFFMMIKWISEWKVSNTKNKHKNN